MRRRFGRVLEAKLDIMSATTDLKADAQRIAYGACNVREEHLARLLVDVPELRFQARHVPIDAKLNKVDGIQPTVHFKPVRVSSIMNGEGEFPGGGAR